MKKMLYYTLIPLILDIYSIVKGQQCGRHSCHGDVGNLAVGRVVTSSSTCGQIEGEIFCDPGSASCSSPVCRRCRAGRQGHAHPSFHMIDSPFFHPRTWWQSAGEDDEVTLTFNLETTFYFTHLIMLFRSPRPGAMTIERSIDFGKTWTVYQRYSRNCTLTFGMDDDEDVEGGKCTSRYSDPVPCHKGEVIYRVLNPSSLIDDPYSDQARHLLKITNLRIRMWDPQPCPSCSTANITDSRAMSSVDSPAGQDSEEMIKKDHPSRFFTKFAIYDLIIRGTCFCNGHADTCIPIHEDKDEPSDQEQNVVHGKCICEHNTAGDHCQRCLPLYNDAPWKPGNGDTGTANPCKRCTCHGHAVRCSFDSLIYASTGNRSGGVCECMHNTFGRHCGQCQAGYFRRVDSELSDPDMCQECLCHPIGSLQSEEQGLRINVSCDPTSGQCRCKPGVGGRRCDRCIKGFWGFSEDGCKECLCGQCEQKSGVCLPDYGEEAISFVDFDTEDSPPGYDLTRPWVENDSEDFFEPFVSATDQRIGFPQPIRRFPNEGRNMLPVYPAEPFVISRSSDGTLDADKSWNVAASWRPTSLCKCKEKKLGDHLDFCTMDYDYAVKLRVKEAVDLGTHATLLVSVRRIIKQSKVKIYKGKTVMYPESWTIMGCTCPVLMPGHDYLVVGHEDIANGRLMINVESLVRDWWSEGKNMSRSVKKYFRKKCDY